MRAIILAGGRGTRLQSVVSDVPKPLAPMGDKPFLAYLLDYLQLQGVTEVIFSLHYLADKIQQYFSNQYKDMKISYVLENMPLGTGGAIRYVLSQFVWKEPVFIINGDTFLKLNYKEMLLHHQRHNASLTLAAVKVLNPLRYGSIGVKGSRVVAFHEKSLQTTGLINAGVYLIAPDLFNPFKQLPSVFSFEKDFMQIYLNQIKPVYYKADDYFIDIGIPEDYYRAIATLPENIRG